MIGLYTITSVAIVSLVSLVGVVILFYKKSKIDRLLLLLLSLSVGTLFGGAFLHLIPEAIEAAGEMNPSISLLILAGIVVFFLLDKLIHWNHISSEIMHKKADDKTHIAYLNILGDGFHNFLDGLIIAGSYLVSIPTGIATTIAVIVHEIPQEIADFGVLLYSGFSKWKALAFNFLSATMAILGAVLGLTLGTKSEGFIHAIVPFAGGAFTYIAGSNLLPELFKSDKQDLKETFLHLIAIILGIALMYALLFLE